MHAEAAVASGDAMEASLDRLVEDLRGFPGPGLALLAASVGDRPDPFVTLELVAGEMFNAQRLEVSVFANAARSRLELLGSEGVPDGVVEAVAAATQCSEDSSGASAVRSAILRLCEELCVGLSEAQFSALAALGRGPVSRGEEVEAGCSAGAFLGSAASSAASPTREDVLTWRSIVDGLKCFPGKVVQIRSAGSWDGAEGIVELAFSPGPGSGWDQVVIIIIAGSMATRVELKGAQAVPDRVRHQVSAVDFFAPLGTGPMSVVASIRHLCQALGIELRGKESRFLAALGDKKRLPLLVAALGAKKRRQEEAIADGGGADAQLARESRAAEAMKAQLELLDFQIELLAGRAADAPRLRHELGQLRRTRAEVAAERDAALASVQAALLRCSSTRPTEISVSVDVSFSSPAQSLRGHSGESAASEIQASLARSGPWGHYAAQQFSMMLGREQELHGEFLCFYHSYSYAALLYEVHAEVARVAWGLPQDLAPVPRLSLASGPAGAAQGWACCLDDLRRRGGRDHDPAFRALGISASCSLFASSSEAPPLTCFQGGYSCTDLSFRLLLTGLLATCGGMARTCRKVQKAADRVVAAAKRNNLPSSMYEVSDGGGCPRGTVGLSGYMLQIFVHRSIAEQHAYPSKPYGVPIQGGIIPYLDHTGTKADGQARVLFDPRVFLDPTKARLFHYCARPLQSCMDSGVPSSRGAFIRELRAALQPLLEGAAPGELAARLWPPSGPRAAAEAEERADGLAGRPLSLGYRSMSDDEEKFAKAYEANDYKGLVALLPSKTKIEAFEERMHPWADDPTTVGALAATQLAIQASLADKENPYVKEKIFQAGAIPPLVSFLKSEETDRFHTAVVALSFLTADCSSNTVAAYEAGAMPLLQQHISSPLIGLRAAVASTLRNICMERGEYRAEFVETGGLEGLVKQLNVPESADPSLPHVDLQLEAILNLQDVIEDQDGNLVDKYAQKARDAGVVPLLQQLALSKDEEVWSAAVGVLNLLGAA